MSEQPEDWPSDVIGWKDAMELSEACDRFFDSRGMPRGNELYKQTINRWYGKDTDHNTNTSPGMGINE